MSDLRYYGLAVGVWISFILFGYCQESLTRQEFGGKRFVYPIALVVLSSLTNVLVASSIIVFKRLGFSGGVPAQHWVVCGLAYYGAQLCGLTALQHIIYPLQVVIKSCKAVPVLVGEVVLAGSRPSFAKVFSVLQLSAGAGLFMYFSEHGGQSKATDNIWYGALLACAALVCDAVYGPYQNRILQKWKPTAWHLMLQLNMYQCFFAVLSCSMNSQLTDAIGMLMQHQWAVGGRLAMYCASLTLGNVFIYQMQHEFGALSVAKTTTVRKLVSVALSVVLFGHTLKVAQYAAMATVFAAPVVEHQLQAFLSPAAKSTKAAASKSGVVPTVKVARTQRAKSPAAKRGKSPARRAKKD